MRFFSKRKRKKRWYSLKYFKNLFDDKKEKLQEYRQNCYTNLSEEEKKRKKSMEEIVIEILMMVKKTKIICYILL